MNYRTPNEKMELWDCWLVYFEDEFHLFHLCRDWWDGSGIKRNYIGHAVSRDCLHWETKENLKMFSEDEGKWNSNPRTLTGNIFYNEDDGFYMTYGHSLGGVQVNGIAYSKDLYDWVPFEENPVIVPEYPYENDPEKTLSGYVAGRDASIYKMLDGSYEAIFCARENEGHFYSRGAIGRAVSKDLKKWEMAPPLARTHPIQEPEVPSRFSNGSFNYIIFCSSFGYETDMISHNNYEHLNMATYYMKSRDRFSGFQFSPCNALAPGDAYVGRILEINGQPLFFHHISSVKSAFGIPKKVHFDDNGDITLRLWEGIENIYRGAPMKDFNIFKPLYEWMNVKIADVADLGEKGSPAVAITSEEYEDFQISFELINHTAMKAGICLRVSNEQTGIICEVDYNKRLLRIGECHTKSYILFGLDTSKQTYAYRFDDTLNIDAILLNIVVRSESCDWYFNESLIYTTSFDDHSGSGKIAFVTKDGCASIKNMLIQPLEPEATFRK